MTAIVESPNVQARYAKTVRTLAAHPIGVCIGQHWLHLAHLLVDTLEEVMDHAEVCVVGTVSPESAEAVAAAAGLHVIDLVRLEDALDRRGEERYVGVAW